MSKETGPTAIERAFSDWKLSTELAKIVGTNYEAQNVLERWLISNVNSGSQFTSTAATDDQFLKEWKGPKTILSRIKGRIESWKFFPDPSARPAVGADGQIRYKDFQTRIDPARIKSWRSPLVGDAEIATIAMWYGSLLSRGQQWSIPDLVYQNLASQCKADLEGFASPLNNHLKDYCSIGPYDGLVGSLGSFFDLTVPGRVIVVNPPFVESLLQRAATKSIDLANTNGVIFIGPQWRDAAFYQSLERIGAAQIVLEAGKYYYEENGKKVPTSFNSVVFVLGSANVDCVRAAFGLLASG